MTEYYTHESAADLLREVTGINEFPDNCSGLAACLNSAIEKLQDNYTTGEKRIEVGDYIGIDLWAGCYVDGVVDHVPSKSNDCWIIICNNGYVRYIYNPPAITLIRKGEIQK